MKRMTKTHRVSPSLIVSFSDGVWDLSEIIISWIADESVG